VDAFLNQAAETKMKKRNFKHSTL